MKKNNYHKNKAQGTIEYLVIIAIVVVIGLIVAGLSANLFDSQQITQTTNEIQGQLGTGGISVIDTVADYDGTGYLNLKNTSGETITLTKITTTQAENTYEQQWAQGNTQNIQINNLCICEPNQTTKTCEFTIHYTTKQGLQKRINQTITIECAQNPTPTNPNQTTTPKYSFMNNDCYNNTQDPIQICTLTDLNRIRENLNANYILIADINATPTKEWNNGEGWEPISPFAGNFNGNNKIINNLYINRPTEDDIGLIGVVKLSTIQNLNLINVNVIGKDYVGSVIGKLDGSTILINCNSTGNISGYSNTGGIIGGGYYPWATDINNLSFSGNVMGESECIGGIVGYTPGKILNSVFNGVIISDSNYVGGIAGFGRIENSYSIGTIKGYNYVGGLAGLGIDVIKSYSNADVNGNSMVGGIAGYIGMDINDCYSTGTINANSTLIGGIVGKIDYSGEYGGPGHINNTYSTSKIILASNLSAGGITGLLYGLSTLENSFFVGQITNYSNRQGGVIGNYNSLVGYYPEISKAYWDTYITGKNNCYEDSNVGCTPTNNQANLYYGESGIPFSQLGWSTDIWTSRVGDYPILSWQ